MFCHLFVVVNTYVKPFVIYQHITGNKNTKHVTFCMCCYVFAMFCYVFLMFCYVLLCFCYVLLCFSMFLICFAMFWNFVGNALHGVELWPKALWQQNGDHVSAHWSRSTLRSKRAHVTPWTDEYKNIAKVAKHCKK